MKNILVLMFFTIIILSCEGQKKLGYPLIATCEKIIIQDSVDYHTIHFLVSYKNTNQNDILIYTNSYNKMAQQKRYAQSGVYLKGPNVNTPIGQFHSSNVLPIRAGKSLKVLYTYSEQYPNQKNTFNSQTSIKNQLKGCSLKYHYNKKVMDSIILKDEKIKKMNADFMISDFDVDMSNAILEYNKNLTVEDAINLVGGKINK